MNDPMDERAASPANISLQYEALEQSLEMPTFEFSSPISSIGSNCSSPERTIQPQPFQEHTMNDSSDYVSLEELKSQISPPSDDDCSGVGSSKKGAIDVLETIFEDCYLETPPGTPTTTTTPRPKKPRRHFRMNLSNSYEEFKENVQNNDNQQKM